jgi:hypothetical protein
VEHSRRATAKAREEPARKITPEAKGRALAIRLLYEMEEYETKPGDVTSQWPWSIEAKYRPEGTRQDNVLLRYLDDIQGNREVLTGFCAVFTDHLGQAGNVDQVRFISSYEELTERGMTGKPGPWPTLE